MWRYCKGPAISSPLRFTYTQRGMVTGMSARKRRWCSNTRYPIGNNSDLVKKVYGNFCSELMAVIE